MPRTTRTFIAIKAPDDLARKLAHLQERIGPEVPGARWVEPGKFHVTLAFLGDVDDSDIRTLADAVGAEVARFDPLPLELAGLGAFPDPIKPRTLWVGLRGAGVAALEPLHRAVVKAARASGYPPTDGRFHPHVTLARLKTGKGSHPDLSPLVKHFSGWSAGRFVADRVVTFASNLASDGPSYIPLATALLEGSSEPPSP